MAHKDNTLSVSPGNIVLNGCRVSCVTDFKYECIGNGIANVKIAFDIPVKNTEITNQNLTSEIRIPVKIGDTLVDEIVIPPEDDVVSRKELLELALPTLDRNIKSAASGDINYKCLEQFLLQRNRIKEELKAMTAKED